MIRQPRESLGVRAARWEGYWHKRFIKPRSWLFRLISSGTFEKMFGFKPPRSKDVIDQLSLIVDTVLKDLQEQNFLAQLMISDLQGQCREVSETVRPWAKSALAKAEADEERTDSELARACEVAALLGFTKAVDESGVNHSEWGEIAESLKNA